VSDDLDSLVQRAAEEVVQQADLDTVVDLDDDALPDPQAAIPPIDFEDAA
jgi:hypothetical protein